MAGLQSAISQLSENVSSSWGMTNRLVDQLARSLATRLYRGLFIPEKLTTARTTQLLSKIPFTMIVNVGGHFVALYCCKEYVLYFDPFGMPCLQPQVIAFLRGLKRSVFFSREKIQSVTSKHCGLYAVLFVLYHDKPRRRFKLKFGRRASKKNDKLCIQYLHKLCK